MNKEEFIKSFSQSFAERRFSLVPDPYIDTGLYEDYGKCKKTTVVIEPGNMLFYTSRMVSLCNKRRR
jgi:hypothetical protein